MREHPILSTSYGVALADETVPCVITQWHKFANKAEFIALQGAALAYFEQLQLHLPQHASLPS